jgi:membrane protein implicated in regulation of membrane protease activity
VIVLAHQGGWDEVVLFAVVGLVAVAALRRAERRARRRQESAEGKDQTGG